MRNLLPPSVLAVLATLLSGCSGLYGAYVPETVLTDGWAENEAKRHEETGFLGLGTNQMSRTYEFTQEDVGGPYPAQFIVVSARIIGGGSRSELLAALDSAVQQVMEDQGIALDPATRTEGERHLVQDQPSIYFTYVATAEGGAPFFDPDRRIRILGEVFSDGSSDISVILIGMAQTTGSFQLPGSEDVSNWAKIVGDPGGSVDGFVASDGLAFSVVSHG